MGKKFEYFSLSGGLFAVLLIIGVLGIGGSVYADALNAMFTTAPSSGPAPLNVSFIDQSEGEPVHWTWDFDDGSSIVSGKQNPIHKYTEPGTYYPILVVDNNTGNPVQTSTLIGGPIEVYPPILSANFTGVPHYGNVPINVGFIDQSTGPVGNWTWDYDVGNIDPITSHTGTGKNPNHTYVNPGKYRVELTISDNYTTATAISDNFTFYPIQPPVVDFSASPRSGIGPLDVSFTCLVNSSEPLSYEWDFGDETPISIEPHPSHLYTKDGDYNVTVGVTGPGGETVAYKTGYISVSTTPPPIADFALAPTEGIAPLKVNFIGLANGTGNLQYTWNFGDGIGTGTGRNPSYSYTDAGNYNVTCSVSDGTKTGAVTRNYCVRVYETPAPALSFASAPTSGESPLNVTFIDLSSGLNASPVYHWIFGDGGSVITTEKSYVYKYLNVGTWTPQLNIESDGILYSGPSGAPITIIEPPNPEAMFAASPRNGIPPLEVVFIDQSEGENPLSWEWDFGDESLISYIKNPVHTYEKSGTYNVSLMIHAANGDDLTKEIGFITVQNPVLPKAEFAATPVSGPSPLSVSFIDQSTGEGPFHYEWTFGDGSNVSYEKNPVHQYIGTGSYAVNLTVTNNAGIAKAEKPDYISVGSTNYPEAGFLATPKNGTAPLTVSFIDQSRLNPLLPDQAEYSWMFGDGNSSTEKSPEYTYEKPGEYKVNLTVTHGGISSEPVSTTILVTHADDPTGMFTVSPQNGACPLTVSFIDQSKGTGPFSYKWDFGDGTPLSYIQNPVHTYKETGKYDVTMQVIGSLGSDVIIQKDLINVSSYLYPVAAFTTIPQKGSVPLTVKFIDQSELNPDSSIPVTYSWQFGDGNSSTVQNPTWIYTEPDEYDVTMTVKQGEIEDTAKSSVVVDAYPVPNVSFSMAPLVGVAPLKVSFIDLTCERDCPFSYYWDFGDENSSTKKNTVPF